MAPRRLHSKATWEKFQVAFLCASVSISNLRLPKAHENPPFDVGSDHSEDRAGRVE